MTKSDIDNDGLQDVLESIGKLRKHLENADHLISYLESDLDKCGAYHYVDSAMYDLKLTYDELLKQIETLECDLDNVVEED